MLANIVVGIVNILRWIRVLEVCFDAKICKLLRLSNLLSLKYSD